MTNDPHNCATGFAHHELARDSRATGFAQKGGASERRACTVGSSYVKVLAKREEVVEMTKVTRNMTRSARLRALRRRRFHRRLVVTFGAVMVSLAGALLLLSSASNASAGGGIFHTICGYSHSLLDDPIVFPNVPGRSHMHDFGGNSTTNANSTLATLQAGTTNCFVHAPDAMADRSGYWVPQLYFNGTLVSFSEQQAYYQSGGLSYVNTPPTGLELVAGNHHATGPQSTNVVKFTCSGSAGSAIGGLDHPPICPAGLLLKIVVFTQNCLAHTLVVNGADGVNDTSQATYAVNGACPAGDDPIAQARIEVKYPAGIDGRGTIAFSPDLGSATLSPYYTMHADWFNAWVHSSLVFFFNLFFDTGG
ncbi:MAG: DUF1996 domain-containing protein, partial [Acidimicrobiales bacterium]